MQKIQFPEIVSDTIVFTLTEETIIDGSWNNYFMVISFGQIIVYKEQITFEYFERFIEVGEALKDKYQDKIFDFILNVNGYLLYGDSFKAFIYVEKFIKSIKGRQAKNSTNQNPSTPN